MTRKEAIAQGLKTYFTGKPCRYGHIDTRRTDNKCCSECYRQKAKIRTAERRKKHPDKVQAEIRKCRYGITPEQFNKLSIDQNNQCDICGNAFTATAHIDHDHKTGQIRGLLCTHCNHGLGHFRDSKILLLNAVKYLSRAEQQEEGTNLTWPSMSTSS